MTITKEQCERAFTWSSMQPEKRGESLYNFYIEKMNALPEEKRSRFESLFSKYLSAESRCASPMVTGPAKFPAERNRKRIEFAMKHWERLSYFCEDRPEVKKQTLTEAKEKLETLKNAHSDKHYWERTLSADKIERLENNLEAIDSFQGGSYPWGNVENHKEDQRIRFFFNDKPSQDIITLLKKNGMKWSPKNKAWQRQTTKNAVYAVNKLISTIQEETK